MNQLYEYFQIFCTALIDDNDGLYVKSWLSYSNADYLIVEYVKD